MTYDANTCNECAQRLADIWHDHLMIQWWYMERVLVWSTWQLFHWLPLLRAACSITFIDPQLLTIFLVIFIRISNIQHQWNAWCWCGLQKFDEDNRKWAFEQDGVVTDKSGGRDVFLMSKARCYFYDITFTWTQTSPSLDVTPAAKCLSPAARPPPSYCASTHQRDVLLLKRREIFTAVFTFSLGPNEGKLRKHLLILIIWFKHFFDIFLQIATNFEVDVQGPRTSKLDCFLWVYK